MPPAQGVRGMRMGGQRKLIVPPGLAYGKKGIGEVPPDATLEFEVRLPCHLRDCAQQYKPSMYDTAIYTSDLWTPLSPMVPASSFYRLVVLLFQVELLSVKTSPFGYRVKLVEG